MNSLYTELQLKISKPSDLLPCECYMCFKTFHITKAKILRSLSGSWKKQYKYCSKSCRNKSLITSKEVSCLNCDKVFNKRNSQVEKHPNNFCSRSCAATYNNTHKTKGYRRSKLEIFIEEQLIQLYPNLTISFNKKSVINSELDIYIPSLNLAFEINGIFHYKSIYGDKKFQKTKENDKLKIISCKTKNIKLYTIDCSQQIRFNTETSLVYLKQIIEIIKVHQNSVLVAGLEPTRPET